jgi:hypothetical protein
VAFDGSADINSLAAAQIPDGADLNTYVVAGNYACNTTAGARTLENCPVDTQFSLVVQDINRGSSLTDRKVQIITSGLGVAASNLDRMLIRTNGSGGWTAWKEISLGTFITTAIVYTVPLNEAQAFLNAMGKYINRSITILVPPGEITGDIILDRFYGPGVLNLYAVDENGVTVATRGVETHKTSRVRVLNTSCNVNVQGFTATATTVSGFEANNVSTGIQIAFCNAVEGSNTTTGNRGADAIESSGVIFLNECTFSNKSSAVSSRNQSNKVVMRNARGSNNAIGYHAENGGDIRLRTGNALTADTLYHALLGGLIVTENGIPESLIAAGI